MSEKMRLDSRLGESIGDTTRARVWESAEAILRRGDPNAAVPGATGLALGYVQSGKTTSITALAASAADAGYQIVVALLGSTNLLLAQNKARLEEALGIGTRSDYVWVSEANPASDAAGKRLLDFVERGRVCLVPILKHAGRIDSAARQLSRLPGTVRVLIIDDEADQASLNTSKTAESRTYAAIKGLRDSIPNHLYVQYTATPYAPLLLDSADILSPDFVEFLSPGEGYTGGKEFFIDNAGRVVRNVPLLDEQASKSPPLELQRSLSQALASFVAGATLLLNHDNGSPPISMLVHSTARNDVQARYEFLIRRQIKKWRETLSPDDPASVPSLVMEERSRLVDGGAIDVDDQAFSSTLDFVLRETTTWLVNSAADVNRVDWHVAPIHVLVGGNKLDRGFTVEGLTVTYMNRPASPQVDTLEQRARAFGYRGDLLPYCQFFASKRTIRSLTEIVHTEEDLRARLRDHVEGGGSVHTWAKEIGLLLPDGMAPTRPSVVRAITSLGLGWHALRRPSLSAADNSANRALVDEIGLFDAPRVSYGRLAFHTLQYDDLTPIDGLLSGWRRSDYSPGWLHEELVDGMRRNFSDLGTVTVMLMDDWGGPRVRKWEDGFGFVNLFQGRDLKPQPHGDFYPGDRDVLGLAEDPRQIVVQVHRNKIRDDPSEREVLTLAMHLGAGLVVRRGETHD